MKIRFLSCTLKQYLYCLAYFPVSVKPRVESNFASEPDTKFWYTEKKMSKKKSNLHLVFYSRASRLAVWMYFSMSLLCMWPKTEKYEKKIDKNICAILSYYFLASPTFFFVFRRKVLLKLNGETQTQNDFSSCFMVEILHNAVPAALSIYTNYNYSVD